MFNSERFISLLSLRDFYIFECKCNNMDWRMLKHCIWKLDFWHYHELVGRVGSEKMGPWASVRLNSMYYSQKMKWWNLPEIFYTTVDKYTL